MDQINTLYTLKLLNVICQLYLSKAGKIKIFKKWNFYHMPKRPLRTANPHSFFILPNIIIWLYLAPVPSLSLPAFQPHPTPPMAGWTSFDFP